MALVSGVPGAVLATGILDDDASISSFAAFTPAAADPDLARMIAARGGVNGLANGRMMRFTPAGAVTGLDRSVTVAVRVDGQAAQAVSVRNAIANARGLVPDAGRRIVPTRYDLGLARGYSSFAAAPAPALAQRLPSAAIPDLADFEPTPGVREEPSRFAARIALEQEGRAAPSAPQTHDDVVDQRLDVAGSYRLTRNLDVTAGVRYEQDRDRINGVANFEQQDSQAVYVGTQFRF